MAHVEDVEHTWREPNNLALARHVMPLSPGELFDVSASLANQWADRRLARANLRPGQQMKLRTPIRVTS